MTDPAGKRVTVMGLGRFGGGIGVTRWLASQGADVLVTDRDPATDLADSIHRIKDLVDKGSVTLRLGEHNVSDFTACDLVVASAAVPKPWDNRFLRAAEGASIPITTEISLALEQLLRRGCTRTVGITGSAGKSTTTAMIHHALQTALPDRTDGRSKVVLGGNIGGSLLEAIDSIDADTRVVLELSSAQLYWLGRTMHTPWSPRVAVVTNLSPNHLDWHGALDHYRSSKQELLKHQRPGDTAVLGPGVWDWRTLTPARAIEVDPASFPLPIKLPGEHNRFNAAAALEACAALEPALDRSALARAIAAFGGLAHRLQLVAEAALPNGGPPVRYYNDSKSTTPESALKAVEAVAAAPGGRLGAIHLIAGGYDKGSDLAPIARLAPELAGLYTLGATGPALATLAGGEVRGAFSCATLAAAFDRARSRLRPGDVLLLSPGCASWDQYVNFEARGDEFVALVHAAVERTA